MTENSAAEPVRLDFDGPVATITLDRPHKKNALDPEAWTMLDERLRAVAASDARVLVLTGAGGEFCSGADTSAPRPASVHPLDRMDQITAPLVTLQELPIPVVAKVDGVAVGAGWSLAMCADVVVASRRARFSQIFARRGLSPDTGATWLLTRAVGLQTAKRLAFLAEVIGAEEAKELGLVTWLVDEDGLDEFTADLVGRLAASPPVALRLTKQLLDQAGLRSFRDAVAAENVAQAVNFATDAPVARDAIVQGKPAEFTGRWRS